MLAHFGYGAVQKGVAGDSLLTPDSFPFSYGSNSLMYAYLLYILYRSYTFPSPKNMDVSDFSPWHFVNAQVWAKLMTDAAWYDKGLLLECKGEFRICSYAGLAVDSVMYCIICTTYAMMIFDIDMYVVGTRLMCMTYARIIYTHVYDVSIKICITIISMSLPRMTWTVNDTISQPLFTIPLWSDFHFPNQLPLLCLSC